jgi:hypothetical protein
MFACRIGVKPSWSSRVYPDMALIQSMLHKVLLAILAIAGVSDASRFNVPRLVGQARDARAASSVSATWEGTTGQGRPVSLRLKADGAAVSGWLTFDEQSGAIKDGRIEKGTLTFAAVIAGRSLTFAGETAGAEMTLRLGGARNPLTLRRVK